ncbi:MAG TPA: MBL fold metallo-hydrolase [Nitrospirota bacterium]|nr:MBL fold metallo-hydrolase [Nitrospirota bacterium]
MHESIKVFRQISPPAADPAKALLVKFRIYLPDRPGSLAGFASAIAQAGGNISSFHYDRAADSSCVAVNIQIGTENNLQTLLDSLSEKDYRFERSSAPEHEVLVTSAENVLEVKVRLANIPGALAAFARLLAGHDANVTYMLYDEDIDAESADIAMATKDPGEVDVLLKAINEQGYHYRVVYRGSNEQEAANIIGLKMVEKFFLRLKRLLPSSDLAEIRSLVESSRDLYQDLVQFSTEAGNNLEAGDVFETVLTFASRSRSHIKDKFSAAAMQPLRFHDRVTLQGFRLPTSENVYLLSDGNELAMIDAGHGIYYEDLKRLFKKYGMDPSKVRRIYVTHPDTDHAGSAGYFEREFGTQVFMHPGSMDVMTHMNRAYGAGGSLLNLNKYYTRLSNRFTECLFPERPLYFPDHGTHRAGPFNILTAFSFGPLVFEVLESLGGHTPGLVFFLNREFGLLFTSDFLLNTASLSAEEKEHLALYRYLLTSPNRDSRIYKEESAALKDLMTAIARELKPLGKEARIFPGHGDHYSADPGPGKNGGK